MSYNDKRIRNITGVSVRNMQFTDSTINSAPADPPSSWNYSRLIEENSNILLDSFFTLESYDDQLIHVSEVVRESASPNYGTISIAPTKRFNSCRVKIKVWTRHNEKWALFLQWNVDLRHLVYLDTTIENLDDRLTDNCIIIRLNSRYYTAKRSIISLQSKSPQHGGHLISSYSFDVIRSINNLDRSIRELEASKKTVSKSITAKKANQFKHNHVFFVRETARMSMALEELDKAIAGQNKIINLLSSQKMNLKVAINNIKEISTETRPLLQNRVKHEIEYIKHQVPSVYESLQANYPAVQDCFQTLGKAITEIITIDKKEGDWNLSVMGNEFPANIKELLDIVYYDKHTLASPYTDEHTHVTKLGQINAGLCYIVQVTQALLAIVEVEVFYPMEFNGEYWVIRNFKNEPYPLFYDKADTERGKTLDGFVLHNYKFERALLYLNKNILLIIDTLNDIIHAFEPGGPPLANNIPIDCLDNFLWSLQYVLLFLTAN